MNIRRTLELMFKYRLVILLTALFVGLTLSTDKFWTLTNWQGLSVALAIDGIMVVGMTIAMIGGGFDLSIGSVMALSGVIAALLQESLGIPLALLIAIVAATFVGLINGFFITRLGINPFIATLGSMITVRGLVMTITDADPVVIRNMEFVRMLGRGQLDVVPIPAIIFLAALIFGHFFLTQTPIGRNVYAMGGNEDAARASGIRTNRVKLVTYMIVSTSAGISGVILASRLGTGSPIVGENTALSVITAVLLGGTSLTGGVGSMGGSLLGLLVVGILTNGLNLLNVPAYYQRVAQGILLVLIVIIDRLYARARMQAFKRTRGLASKQRGAVDGAASAARQIG